MAWEQDCTCQKFLVRAPNKVCTWQKFLVGAVRATDFRRGAATPAPASGLRPVRRDSGHGVYWCGTHSTPSDLFLRSTSMDRLAAMEAFVLVVDTGAFSAAARPAPRGGGGGGRVGG